MVKKYLLFLILILAAVVRIWHLNTVPPHLTQDEAALGYNAYSILKTMRDEHGKILPIFFESFGDYKPGLYIYLSTPFIAALGLNEWAVRLPSAVMGVASVFLVYLLVKHFETMHKLNKPSSEASLALISAALLAINPWHIQFSRGAWEANVSLTLTLLGIIFLLRSFEKRTNLLLSGLFFSLTLITYQGSKLSSLIVIYVMLITFWREVLKLFKKSKGLIFTTILSAIIISSPVLLSIEKGQLGRIRVFSVFSYPREEKYLQDFLHQGKEKVGTFSYYLYHSELNNFSRGIFGRWFNHFSGRFLFFEGDYQNPKHSPPYQGVMLFAGIIFLPLGVIVSLKKTTKYSIFLILWLVLSPLPSILSRDQVQAVRSINMLIPLVLITAYGLFEASKKATKLNNIFLRGTLICSFVALYIASFVYYLDSYFIHMPAYQSSDWNYGYKQIFSYLYTQNLYKKEVFIGQSYAQPYIYYLFYNKYDPNNYQAQANTVVGENEYDVGFIENIDNIHFVQIKWGELQNKKGIIVVAKEEEFPYVDIKNNEKIKLLEEIRYFDQKSAYRILEVI